MEGGFLLQTVRGVERVAEEGLATRGAGAQRVQELEVRRVGRVEEVHVQAEELRRVGNVFGFLLGPDVPSAPVEGVFESTYSASDVYNGFFRLGDVPEEKEPVLVEVGECV